MTLLKERVSFVRVYELFEATFRNDDNLAALDIQLGKLRNVVNKLKK